MKHLFNIILYVALSLLGGSVAYANSTLNTAKGTGTTDDQKFPVSGVWAGGRLESNVTVYVKGTVWIKSPVIIPSGKTMTIEIDHVATISSPGVRIRPHKSFAPTDGGPNRLFEIESGGKLVVKGIGENKEVLFKANALQPEADNDYAVQCDPVSLPSPFENNDLIYGADAYNTKFNAVKAKTLDWGAKNAGNKTGSVIIATGTLDMTWVRLYDAYSSGKGAAISRTHSEDGSGARVYGPITLKNCRITQNYSVEGTAIYVQNQTKDDNSPTSCAVTLTDCYIGANVANPGKLGAAGIIRTGGGAIGNISMTRTEIVNNYTYGDGIVYWNANGKEGTVLTLDECDVHHNYSENDGGGVTIQGTFDFTGGKSKIHHNQAGRHGGGVWVIPYGGGANIQATSVDITFDNVQIYNNKAVHGAGVYAEIRAKSDYNDGTDLNLIFDGAELSSNNASENGGGVYFINANTSLDINFKVKSGTISSNTAGRYGGGIYCELTDGIPQDNCHVYLNGGTISSNTAGYSGGGISVYGLRVQCDQDASGINIVDNTATAYYGGGLHLEEGASCTMYSGAVSSNKSAKQGGGIFVRDSDLVLNGGRVFDNTSSDSGGGVWVGGSSASASCTISSGYVYGNTAQLHGGGMYVSGKAAATVTGGEFYSNTATTGDGGGIYCIGTLNVNGGTIGKDQAQNSSTAANGGGICLATGEVSQIEYSATCTLTGGSVSHNEAAVSGGGIYMYPNTTAHLTGGSVSENDSSSDGAGVYVNGAEFNIENGMISGNISKRYGGGIYIESGECHITGGEIDGNEATYGAGFFVNGNGRAAMNGGSIVNNTASVGGGGIFAFGNVDISGDARIVANKATGTHTTNSGGGAVQIAGSAELHMHDGNPEISGNIAVFRGGGLRVRNGSSAQVTIDNGTISGNEAQDGGGISVEAGTLKLNGGQISGNTCLSYGGGVFLSNMSSAAEIKEVIISDNTSNKHGGGVYLYSGTLNLTGGQIRGNVAVRNGSGTGFGGGIFTYDNTCFVNISGGKISENSAFSGAGVFLTDATLDFTNGTISENVSTNAGGAIYMQNAATARMSGGNIIGNHAVMGGGIYQTGNSTMTFGNGIIRSNIAVYNGGSETTAYNNTTHQGVGGGICVDGAASFIFSDASAVGLYGNIAHKAGDDILLSGAGGSVTLPDVSSMDLSGYNSKTSELYWVEDYMTNDTEYDRGTAMAGTGHKAVRYRDAVDALSKVYVVPAGTYTKYLALSIGYEVVFVTIVRSGLLKGENAIYRISRLDTRGTNADASDDQWTTFSEVLITGPADANPSNAMSKSSSKTISLYSGTWKVEEVGWAWSYKNPNNAIIHTINSSSSPLERSFVFTGSKLTSGDEKYMSPMHYGESVVGNNFGSGTVQTNTSAPESSSSFEKITPNGVGW